MLSILISSIIGVCWYQITGLFLDLGKTILYALLVFNRGYFVIINHEWYWQIGGIGKVTKHILKGVFEINMCEQMLEKSSYRYALFSQPTVG